jgi:ferritin-like metal-binding protein YciE
LEKDMRHPYIVDPVAELLGDKEGATLLQTTLEEEEETDKELTKLAKSAINVAVAK